MATRHVEVRHAEGLHARPAELIARTAMAHAAEITIRRDDHRVDAKSILEVLTLGATQGAQLTVEASGDDAEEAVEAVARLVESDFGIETNN